MKRVWFSTHLGWPGSIAALCLLSALLAQAVAAEDAGRGREIFDRYCAACHGMRGDGAVGPSLKDLKARWTVESTIEWIKNPSPRMPRLFPETLDEQDVKDVATYVNGF